jgi:hypothetical protein
MKPTLYEALGLSQTAASSEIKAALRRLVRRYYAKTRAGHTDVEEALRFLNHASHVLGNPQRRAEYDSELAKGVRTESALTTVGDMSTHEVGRPQSAREAEFIESPSPVAVSITKLEFAHEKPQPGVEAIPEWSAQLADFRRTRAGQLVGLLIAALLLLVVWKLVLPSGGFATTLKFATLGAIATVIAAGFIYALVHALSQSIWKPPASESALTIVEGMIPRWRRDRTVFMGTGGPVEDATWLFRLRMAELKRVSAERVSDPQPLMRLFARLFDYGVWGVTALALLSLLRLAGDQGGQIAEVLAHPLLLPVLITVSWIPLEGWLLAQTQTTPGRWLLCVYLHYQVSNPYAPEELRFTFAAAVRRAFEVWWRGCGAGLPVVSMVSVARAREHISRSGETTWDSERDCLVTHGPVGTLSLVSLGIGLIACTLAFASWWLEPTQQMVLSAQRMYAAAVDRFGGDRDVAAGQGTSAPRIARVDDVATPMRVPVPAAESGVKSGRITNAELPLPPGKTTQTATSVPVQLPSGPKQVSVPVTVSGTRSAAASSAADSAAAPEPDPGTMSPLQRREKRVEGNIQQTQAQQARGDLAGLSKTCLRCADEDWRNPRAFYCAGIGLQGTGRHKQAIEMFNRAGALLSRDDPLKLMVDDAVVRSFRAESGR